MVLLYIHHSCCKGLAPSNYGNLRAHENEGVKNWDPDSLKGREEVYGYVMNCNDNDTFVYIYIHSHGWVISRKEFAYHTPKTSIVFGGIGSTKLRVLALAARRQNRFKKG